MSKIMDFDPGERQRQILTANILAPLLIEQEETIIAQATARYRAGKLSGEAALGVIGELNAIRTLRTNSDQRAKRASLELNNAR